MKIIKTSEGFELQPFDSWDAVLAYALTHRVIWFKAALSYEPSSCAFNVNAHDNIWLKPAPRTGVDPFEVEPDQLHQLFRRVEKQS